MQLRPSKRAALSNTPPMQAKETVLDRSFQPAWMVTPELQSMPTNGGLHAVEERLHCEMMLTHASRAATLALIEDATNELGKPCTDWSMAAGLSIDNEPRVYEVVEAHSSRGLQRGATPLNSRNPHAIASHRVSRLWLLVAERQSPLSCMSLPQRLTKYIEAGGSSRKLAHCRTHAILSRSRHKHDSAGDC